VIFNGTFGMCAVADKYSYEEWRDRPELIPKGGSYYEVCLTH